MTPDRTGHGDKEARTRERAIAALLTSARLEDAARGCGVSKSTLCRWLQEPAFQDAFRAARRQVLEAAVSSLQGATGAAVEALSRNLRCRKPSIEVQAARAVLDHAMRSVEFFELEDRVRQLEAAISQQAGGRR
jgi:hypothetical protein